MNRRILLAIVLIIFAVACSSAGSSSAKNTAANSAQLPKSVADIKWVNYNDSAEGAFSMDVPYGWQVQGGMYRFGYFDVRWMMDIRSLDAKIIFRIDDPNVPPYALPGPSTGHNGERYFKPQQFQMIVSDFRDGKSYAELYAKHRFSSVCTTMTPRTADWTPTMPPAWQDNSNEHSAGAVSYDCPTTDGPRIVTVFVRNTLFRQSNFWVVDPVISVIATPAGTPLAHSMIQHMIDSWRVNPQWKQYQDRMTQIGLNQIRASFGQFMQQMQAFHQSFTESMNRQVAGFEAHQAAQAHQVSQWAEILNGQQTVTDPQTGSTFQVFSGPKANYYENGLGVKVNSNISPGPDFHQLIPTEPQ